MQPFSFKLFKSAKSMSAIILASYALKMALCQIFLRLYDKARELGVAKWFCAVTK
jgi:hypothetical protein